MWFSFKFRSLMNMSISILEILNGEGKMEDLDCIFKFDQMGHIYFKCFWNLVKCKEHA